MKEALRPSNLWVFNSFFFSLNQTLGSHTGPPSRPLLSVYPHQPNGVGEKASSFLLAPLPLWGGPPRRESAPQSRMGVAGQGWRDSRRPGRVKGPRVPLHHRHLLPRNLRRGTAPGPRPGSVCLGAGPLRAAVGDRGEEGRGARGLRGIRREPQAPAPG